MYKIFKIGILAVVFFAVEGKCDTFTNKSSGEVVHGYALNKKVNSRTMVKTVEKGFMQLRLSQWEVEYNHKGREKKVVVVPLGEELKYAGQVKAIKESIDKALSEGGLFILVEVDSAGGNMSFGVEVGTEISRGSSYTPIYCYVKSEKTKGAINAGIVPALASERVYINPAAMIGGISENDPNEDEEPEYEYFDMRELLGENIGEKMTSIFRASIGSLAGKKGGRDLLAMAMVDKNIEVVKVEGGGFVEGVNFKEGQGRVRVWSEKGELLLLDANEAVEAGIADGLAESREDVIVKICGRELEQELEDGHLEVFERLDRQVSRLDEIGKGIGEKFKEYKKADARAKKGLLMQLMRDYKEAFWIANKNPELEINLSYLKMWQSQLEMEYDALK